MENTLLHSKCGFLKHGKKMAPVSDPPEYPALKVFVVLKGIFKHLSASELLNVRLVDRQWNFAAASELVSRRRHLTTIKLYNSSSNQFYDRDYGWYLNFENTRRSLWRNTYGADYRMLEFRHLHFCYPEQTEEFLRILQSPWLTSLTSLTLSISRETCEELVPNWFLPSLPNLQNLSCLIKPDVHESTFSNFAELDSTVRHATNGSAANQAPSSALEPPTESWRRQMCSNLYSFSVSFEEACSFPWTLLDSFHRLQDLKLEFSNAACLIKCAQVWTGTAPSLREIETLQITLIHKSNLKEQVEEAELSAETLATANAKLCNHFRVRTSLNVISMIPVARFFSFLKGLNTAGSKEIKFEIAAPCYKTGHQPHQQFRQFEFIKCLVPKIRLKFPDLDALQLVYLQYFSKIHLPVLLPTNRDVAPHYLPSWKLKHLHMSTIPVEIEPVEQIARFLPIPNWQRKTLNCTSSWFQQLTHLIFQISGWEDCVHVVDAVGTELKCLKKLVLRGSPDVLHPRISLMYFFPEVDRLSFPKDWYYGREVERQYDGLPRLQALEMFGLEQFGTFYVPSVVTEFRKMPCLKSIHLDADFNTVVPASSFQPPKKLIPWDMARATWPSSMENVRILTTTLLK